MREKTIIVMLLCAPFLSACALVPGEKTDESLPETIQEQSSETRMPED